MDIGLQQQPDAKQVLGQPIVMPDGTQPLPLGSGTITCLLGTGGAANVYKIWNPQLESHRAVKLLKPDIALESRRRFQTEIKIMAALSHPNIIEIHTVGVWNTLDFIEMELIDGVTLADLISKKGALPLRVCIAIAVLVTRALVHAHDQKYVLFGKMYHGIIHRDIKPSNIMVSKDGSLKLMDFGVARPITASLMTTNNGAIVGTIQYMAPEQLEGASVDVTADIYAVGMILYEMLTGEKAFPHINLSDLFEAKTKNEFIPLHLFNKVIPKRLKKIVNSCISQNPQNRPQSAAGLLDVLEDMHYSVSDERCEIVLKNFIQSTDDDKTILFAQKHRFGIVLTGAAAAVLIAAALIVTMNLKPPGKTPAQLPGQQTTRTAVPLPAPAAAAQVQAPSAMASTPATPARFVHADKSGRVRLAEANKKTIPSKASAPQPAHSPEPAASAPVSYLDQMKMKLGVSDPLEVLGKVTESGNFASALQIFDDLPGESAADPSAQIFRLRALFGLGKTARVAEILNGPTIDDGEFYLIKAKFLRDQGKIDPALGLLEKAVAVRARNLDAESLRRDCLFCRAQCMSTRFDSSPTETNRKDALDTWFEVKTAVRKYPNHTYYGKAVLEMQRIGNNPIHDKG
jgi:eukaryotic-like serine/threonine-protein kinase